MDNNQQEQNTQGNRTYKDSLFRLVFAKKEDLLDLYNAINGTSYTDADELQVNTLENALYIGVKNDISFLIGYTMNLYEHQSSKNANMPVRGLIYLSRQFENYIAQNHLNIYSSKLQNLPTPQYIVFYNGKESELDERILKLSDAFIKEGGCLECTARLLNINYGHNRELMEKCKRLEEYAHFVMLVRKYQKDNRYSLTEAITKAIDEGIEKGLLVDILTTQRNEVYSVLLSTYDKDLYEKDLKEEGYEEGYNSGYDSGCNEGARNQICELIKRKLEKGKTPEQMADELETPLEEIEELLKLVAEQ